MDVAYIDVRGGGASHGNELRLVPGGAAWKDSVGEDFERHAASTTGEELEIEAIPGDTPAASARRLDARCLLDLAGRIQFRDDFDHKKLRELRGDFD